MGPWVGVVHGCIGLWMGVVHGCMGPWGGGGPWVHGWGECGTEDLEVPGLIPGLGGFSIFPRLQTPKNPRLSLEIHGSERGPEMFFKCARTVDFGRKSPQVFSKENPLEFGDQGAVAILAQG